MICLAAAALVSFIGIKRKPERHIAMAVLDTAIHAAPQPGRCQIIQNGAAWIASEARSV
jgi:hypothetical protein